MKLVGVLLFCSALSLHALARDNDKPAIERAVKDYIESQHKVLPDMMARGIDKSLAKRTYWRSSNGNEFILESSYEDMVDLAARYNINGDKFPESPKMNIEIYDIDKRVASVKLTTDDWIDFMHLYKNEEGNWKVINVLWQFNDTTNHVSN
ncbi:nuclear transport factor 2 family protein [Alteromonas lipolytica]|uniref:Lumazine-binding protein n=1 Tax=Alteromonas lipolytica TaxID=1856405 RepID=A0A1E8FD19_9ALTE|nr:nuclear transport factor 2 family protein [Alteromonas lipolytica]OFI33656.1 hypothetical protein BFC17_18930 [Alteromonas lipolytica]GGF69543.1 hypothetical protein GCM10011338_22190 [Alteromonas lipolytica]